MNSTLPFSRIAFSRLKSLQYQQSQISFGCDQPDSKECPNNPQNPKFTELHPTKIDQKIAVAQNTLARYEPQIMYTGYTIIATLLLANLAVWLKKKKQNKKSIELNG